MSAVLFGLWFWRRQFFVSLFSLCFLPFLYYLAPNVTQMFEKSGVCDPEHHRAQEKASSMDVNGKSATHTLHGCSTSWVFSGRYFYSTEGSPGLPQCSSALHCTSHCLLQAHQLTLIPLGAPRARIRAVFQLPYRLAPIVLTLYLILLRCLNQLSPGPLAMCQSPISLTFWARFLLATAHPSSQPSALASSLLFLLPADQSASSLPPPQTMRMGMVFLMPFPDSTTTLASFRPAI